MDERSPLRTVLAWLAAALWTAVIVGGFSSGEFSRENTGGLVRGILLFFLPDLDEPTLFELHWWVRKTAHFVNYAILAALVSRALHGSARALPRLALPLTLAWVLVTSLVDEGRQWASPDRSGRVRDVMIDNAGGVVALLAIRVRGGRRPQDRGEPSP